MARAKNVAGNDLQSHPVEVLVVVALQFKTYKLKMQAKSDLYVFY
ncbi:hypothetical protein QUB42_11000 [Microcoleus sp. Aus8_D1]